MSKRKTHEEFIQEMLVINSNINVIGSYVDAKTKIKFQCRIDGYEWFSSPSSILYGCGCPLCGRRRLSKKLKKSNKVFLEEVQAIHPNIVVLDKYVNDNTKLRCKCKIDGYEWSSKPNYLLSGHGCHKCSNAERYTTKSFIQKMQTINSEIEILGDYINSHTKIKCRCLLCQHQWTTTPNNLMSNKGCPNCKVSKGERRIQQFLDKYNYEYIQQYKFKDCKNINQLPFDFYLSQYNICIEYDGKQHFKPVEHFGGTDKLYQQKQNDNIKNKYCHDNNIKLLRIPYWEFDNIEKILGNELLKGGG